MNLDSVSVDLYSAFMETLVKDLKERLLAGGKKSMTECSSIIKTTLMSLC